jgi:hypothetical protein
MEELKPCPFCGAIPTIEYEPDISHNSGIYRLSAKHDNTCFIRKMNGMNKYGEMSDRNKDIIVSAWNRRAE